MNNNETNQQKPRTDATVGNEVKQFAAIVARRKDAEQMIGVHRRELQSFANTLNALIQIFELSAVMPSPEHVERVEMIFDHWRALRTFDIIRDNFDLYERAFSELDAAFRAEAAAEPPDEIKDIVRDIKNR